MTTPLDPMLDVVFKLLLSRPDCNDLLVSLLSAVLRPPSPIESVVLLNPELDKDTVRDRGVVLDLRVRLQDKTQVNVEMQAHKRPGMRGRMLYHWARLYGSQLVRGGEYSSLCPCVCVFLLGYEELPSGRFHSTLEVREQHEHVPFTDHLALHVVQLRRLPPKDSAQGREEGPLLGWGRFFAPKDDTEREVLAMSDPILQKAKKVLDELSADPEVQRLAREREEAFLLYQYELDVARREAREEGREQGREEGRLGALRGVAARLRASGFSREEAARVAGIPLEDVE